MKPSSTPVVSVIIPTYNRRDLLETALNSVCAQTLRDFEILVVNDAGEDVKSLLDLLPEAIFCRYLVHENHTGVAAARNTALKNASGKYIAYLDDDDLYYADHLETLVDHLEANRAAVAYTDAHEFIQGRINRRYVTIGQRITYSEDFDAQRLLVHNYIPTLNIVHRKDLLKETGCFDEDLSSHEDWDLWIRFSRIHPFHHIRKVTAAFTSRDQDNSLSSSDPEALADAVRHIHFRYAHLVEDAGVVSQQQTVLKNMVSKASVGKIPDADLRAVFAQKDSLITSLNISVRDKNRELHARNLKLQEQDQTLHAHNLLMQEKDNALQQQQMTLHEKVAALQQQQQAIQEKDKALQQQDALLSQQKHQLERQALLLEEKERTLQQIYHSTSWKSLTFLMRLIPRRKKRECR